jgi:hypothetical protein
MTRQLADLIDRWNTSEGKTYKGDLIDMDAYRHDGGIGCMCAQGQALHVVGGWDADRLSSAKQSEADHACAELLGISVAHSILLRQINDRATGAPSAVLADPGDILGDQWSRVLDFWHYLDKMTSAEWHAARDAAQGAAWDAAQGAAQGAAWASNEIQGAAVLRQKGKQFYFLRILGFSSPEEIPPRPAGYGRGVVPSGHVQVQTFDGGTDG